MGLDNPVHLAFIVVILLLVFGARRLPEIGRSLGSGMREFKDSISGETHPTITQSTAQQPAPPQPVAAQAPVVAPPVVAPPAPPAQTPVPPAQAAQAPAEPAQQA
jgi:sec-independent protein translocase protein TatA